MGIFQFALDDSGLRIIADVPKYSDLDSEHRGLSSISEIGIYRQPLTNGLSDHVGSLEEITLLAN